MYFDFVEASFDLMSLTPCHLPRLRLLSMAGDVGAHFHCLSRRLCVIVTETVRVQESLLVIVEDAAFVESATETTQVFAFETDCRIGPIRMAHSAAY